jgi:FKBP-type peptidyl-prolyl cis-trans isomerase
MQPTQTGIAVALALAAIIFFFFGGLPFSSTTTSSNETQLGETTNTINQNASSTMPTENVTQLQITDEIIGTGAAAAAGDSVTVNYVGSLTNGTVFDASANHGTSGFTFNLGAGQVIKGWDEGIVGMKEGGKRKLIIPAALAYGDQSPAPSIPANSTLVFEVDLLKVQKGAQ